VRTILLIVLFISRTTGYSQNPNPRHLERIAFDGHGNKIVLYGGAEQRTGGWHNPDYVYECDTSGWKEFRVPGPGNRNGPGLIYHDDEKATFLIGGTTQNEGNASVNLDVWKWDGQNWELVITDCPFRSLEAVYNPDNKSILAYGDAQDKTKVWRGGDPQKFELWEFKFDVWRKLSTEGPQTSGPFEMAYDKRRQALIVPIWESGKAVVWEWINGEWKKTSCTENCPEPRNRFALAYHDKEKATYMFGGRNNAKPFLDDFWKWDGKSWTKIETSATPAMRCAATMEYGNNELLLYGGVVEWGLTNEIWQWKNGNWKLLNGDYAMDMYRTLASVKNELHDNANDASLLSRYGSLLKLSKQYTEAEATYKKAVSVNPKEHNTLFTLVELLYNQNKITEAETYISGAIASDLMESRSYSRLGTLLFSIKKYKEGNMCLEKAISMEPRGADYYNLACGYSKLNEKDKAFDALNKAAENGFYSKQQYENDPDIESLKSDVRWKVLLEKLKE
jgi:tetratricopeptide (TPR) repeat protein